MSRFDWVDIRTATEADLPAITEIAVDSWRHEYGELLGFAAVEQYLETSYTSEALHNRFDDHPILVAAEGPTVIAFADVFVEDGRVVISELCTIEQWRRHGCATEISSSSQGAGRRSCGDRRRVPRKLRRRTVLRTSGLCPRRYDRPRLLRTTDRGEAMVGPGLTTGRTFATSEPSIIPADEHHPFSPKSCPP